MTGDSQETTIGVIGAGAFGTALAVVEAAAGRTVRLWGRDAATQQAAAATRRLPRLPGVTLPGTLHPVGDLAALAGADALLLAVPAQATGSFLASHGAALPARQRSQPGRPPRPGSRR